MKTYAATDKYDGMGVRFYFNADSQKEADSKIWGWNRYHSAADCPGFGYHEAIEVNADEVPNESWIHNEWVS
jgi:hypothetical protein